MARFKTIGDAFNTKTVLDNQRRACKALPASIFPSISNGLLLGGSVFAQNSSLYERAISVADGIY